MSLKGLNEVVATPPPDLGVRSEIHADLITKFYTAFQAKDAAAMATCYHPEIVFSDEVFQNLQGPRASAMWRMLCERGKDLAITFRDVEAGERIGWAHWDATYTFSVTGRRVLNKIDAAFTFKDGLIWRHRDTFDLWSWSTMAFGPVGQILGWTPFFTGKLRSESGAALDKFISETAVKPATP